MFTLFAQQSITFYDFFRDENITLRVTFVGYCEETYHIEFLERGMVPWLCYTFRFKNSLNGPWVGERTYQMARMQYSREPPIQTIIDYANNFSRLRAGSGYAATAFTPFWMAGGNKIVGEHCILILERPPDRFSHAWLTNDGIPMAKIFYRVYRVHH